MDRIKQLISTIDLSIQQAGKGEAMDQSKMFKGFSSSREWEDALAEQNRYLKEAYDVDLLKGEPIIAEEMNEKAEEAARFMNGMAEALRDGVKHDHEQVKTAIKRHLKFLGITPGDFQTQTRFFIEDDFHRGCLKISKPASRIIWRLLQKLLLHNKEGERLMPFLLSCGSAVFDGKAAP